MNKKLAMVLTLVFVAVIGLNTFAAQSNDKIVSKMVAMTNRDIAKEVRTADREADKLYREYLKDMDRCNGNEEIQEELTAELNQSLDIIVNSLKASTDAMAFETIAQADALGITVECDLEEVSVGPRTVMIDPLRIADD